MTENNQPRDFISQAGITMTILAWLIFLAILSGIFDYFTTQRVNPNQNIVTTITGYQKEIKLQRNAYGHYVSSGTINGHEVTFLLDTGATDVAIPEGVADKLGLLQGRAFYVQTANGSTRAYRTHLDSVAIGGLVLNNLSASILTNMAGDEVLLGMNFLRHFEIIQKGETLTIRQ